MSCSIKHIMDDPAVSEAVIAADLMTQELSTVHPEDDVYRALTIMARDNHIVLPVVSQADGDEFLGVLSRNDVYDAVRARLDDMRKHLLLEHEGLIPIEHEETLHQLVMGVSTGKTENIQRLLVPLQAIGQSLRESDFRRRFGVQVIAIEQPDGAIQCPPDVDAPLQTSQRLIGIVPDEQRE